MRKPKRRYDTRKQEPDRPKKKKPDPPKRQVMKKDLKRWDHMDWERYSDES